MDCTGTRDRLSEFRDGFLPASEAEAVSAHLAACAECASAAESLAVLRERLRGLPPDPAPPELRARVRAAIGAEAGATSGGAGPRDAGSRPYFSRRWLPLEAAAAVLLFASVYWYQRTSPQPPVAAPAVSSPAGKPAPPTPEKGAQDVVRPRESVDRPGSRAPRAPAGEGVRFVPEVAPAPMPKARSWSPADLPAAPSVRASSESGRIVPGQDHPPTAAEWEGAREAQGEGRVFPAPPSRLLRPVPYGREVVLEVSPIAREGIEERIGAAARRLGGGAEPSDRASAEASDSAAAVRVLVPELSAPAFLEELGRLGTIPPEGKPAAIDIPAGPRAGTVAYTVRIRVR